MVESVNGRIVKSVDEIPAVCLEEDLIAIFRLTSREMSLWRKFPEFIPFPPLPMLDRQIRVSGCVVAWFLAQHSSEYYRSFKSPLEELTKGGMPGGLGGIPGAGLPSGLPGMGLPKGLPGLGGGAFSGLPGLGKKK